MSFIIDLNLVCLVCLQEGELHSVFNKDASNISIGDKIMKCSELCFNEKMRMPNKICVSCIADLEAAYRFRLNCETAKTVFKSLIKKEIIPEIPPEISLNEQKIKIPSGLQIKRIHPVRNASDSQVVSLLNNIKDAASQQEQFLDIQDLDEEENYSTTDYFENAEVLEEDEIMETFEDLNTQDANNDTASSPINIKTENPFEEEHKIKQEISETIEPCMISDTKVKRGRGRPRKIVKLNQAKIEDEQLEKKPNTDVFFDTKAITKSENELDRSMIRYYNPRKKSKSLEVKPAKICDICGNSYKYQHALNSHMRRHRNERPFSCEFCDKAFVSAVELRRHMRVHTGQKPYACKYCDRRFSDFGSRIKHERTHTGERPYICPTCGKGFAYAHVLSVHMRTHTGEKKYKCECGKGFTKKSYLESHMNHHHFNFNEDIVENIKHAVIDDILLNDDVDDDFKLKIDPSEITDGMEEEVDYDSIITR